MDDPACVTYLDEFFFDFNFGLCYKDLKKVYSRDIDHESSLSAKIQRVKI